MERQPLKLDVVSADRMVWQGDVVNVIARTSEGDIGILPGHEPLMAALTPCMVEIVSADGTTGIRILSHEVKPAEEVSLEAARREAHELRHLRSKGEASDEQIHRLYILNAQIRAGERYLADRG